MTIAGSFPFFMLPLLDSLGRKLALVRGADIQMQRFNLPEHAEDSSGMDVIVA